MSLKGFWFNLLVGYPWEESAKPTLSLGEMLELLENFASTERRND